MKKTNHEQNTSSFPINGLMKERQQKGLVIANLHIIVNKGGSWIVPSSSGTRDYRVNIIGKKFFCTCRDFETNGEKCKHIYAAEHASKNRRGRGRPPKKEITLSIAKRKTYPQNWVAYNQAQTKEKSLFQKLLFELCKDVKEIEPSRGRARLPISDAIFAVTTKVYSGFSGRRFISDLVDFHEKGFISQVPHFNSIFNYLENPALTGILTELIVQSSLPLSGIEDCFAVDSTGFITSRYPKWFDHKNGIVKQKHDWVKPHFACGVKTHIVTAVEIHGKSSNDGPILPSLIETTARNFTINQVVGDKAYGSLENMEAVVKHGGVPFFAFKNTATGQKGGKGGIFEKMFLHFTLKREDYLKNYHKRSNVESAVQMIKSKFRNEVRSKTDIAMNNEVLCKFLCHNIVCLVHGIYKLGIDLGLGERNVGGLSKVA